MISVSTFALGAYAQRDSKGKGDQKILQSEETKLKALVHKDQSHAGQIVSGILHKDSPTPVPLGPPIICIFITNC
jgi:hypothetical protein